MEPSDQQKSQPTREVIDPFHMMVGRIASQYAFLEHAIDQSIWKLAEVEPALGACITTQLGSTAARIRALSTLLRLRAGSEDLLKKLNKLTQDNYQITDIRNRAVHDVWTLSEPHNVAQMRVAIIKHEIKIDAVPASMDEMNANLKRVSAQMVLFHNLYHEISAWLDASPRKWHAPLPELSLVQSGAE